MRTFVLIVAGVLFFCANVKSDDIVSRNAQSIQNQCALAPPSAWRSRSSDSKSESGSDHDPTSEATREQRAERFLYANMFDVWSFAKRKGWGFALWYDIYHEAPPDMAETVLETTMNLIQQDSTSSPSDARVTAAGITRLHPALSHRTGLFLKKYFPSLREMFGETFGRDWHDILNLFVARAGTAEVAYTNLEAMVKALGNFKVSVGKDFNLAWRTAVQNSWSDMLYIPARLQLDSVAEAKRFAKLLKSGKQQPFIQIGALVAPNGQMLREETEIAAQYRGKGLFRSTDNLFLVPVRNPFFHRGDTLHQRSGVVDIMPDMQHGLQTIGKGIGLANPIEKDGVASCYTEGEEQHYFSGGLYESEQFYTMKAEHRMKGAFRHLMKNSHWQKWADFFGIAERNLFLETVAKFKPLAFLL